MEKFPSTLQPVIQLLDYQFEDQMKKSLVQLQIKYKKISYIF